MRSNRRISLACESVELDEDALPVVPNVAVTRAARGAFGGAFGCRRRWRPRVVVPVVAVAAATRAGGSAGGASGGGPADGSWCSWCSVGLRGISFDAGLLGIGSVGLKLGLLGIGSVGFDARMLGIAFCGTGFVGKLGIRFKRAGMSACHHRGG